MGIESREAHVGAEDTGPSFAELIASLSQFEGPPPAFLRRLLEVQCQVARARAAAILGVEGGERVKVLMTHPPVDGSAGAPEWMAQSARAAAQLERAHRCHVQRVSGNGHGDEHVVMIPLSGAGGSRAVAAYLVGNGEAATLERTCERIELTMGMLGLYEMRMSTQSRLGAVDRLNRAMTVLDAVNVQGRFKAAAMAFVNEVASGWHAERVTLGFLKGRYVKTVAISHTERYDRKMRLVQDLESAMEESLDQDVEVLHPPPEDATFVCRAAGELSLRHGPTAIATLPLRVGGEAMAVVTVECPLDKAPDAEDLETLRLTTDLCAARLLDLERNDKWIGALAVGATRRGLAHVLGPRHTWAKVAGIAVLAFLLFAFLVKGPDRVDASFEIKAVERRVVSAPFTGRIQGVEVEAGDAAEAGTTVLATLDTAELELRLAALRAERASFVNEADLALREGQTAEVQIARANRRKAEAEIALLEYQVGQARLLAPIHGTVVVGDLKREIGAPVETGDVMFEIAPLDAFRADIEIPEDRIGDLIDANEPGKPRRGTLASVSHPGDYIPFEVDRINPIAEVVDDKNVFRVRVRLLETRDWFRPGMMGVAKVNVGRRPYAYLWTRKAVNWLRMLLWI